MRMCSGEFDARRESGRAKMHTLMRITLVCVCVCATLSVAKCEDAAASEARSSEAEAERKDLKTTVLTAGAGGGNTRRAVGPAAAGAAGAGAAAAPGASEGGSAAARDSQLLSLAAARRRQLFSDRLTHHAHAHALAQKANRNNTTITPTDIRDTNGPDNSTFNGAKPAERIETKEVTRLDARLPETKSAMAMKLYQDSKSRAGFLNNRRKEHENSRKEQENSSPANASETIEGGILYVPEPEEKLEGPEQEAVIDPDEEFQVDESSHGVYLLNFSDTSNITDSTKNKIIGENETKERNLGSNESPIINTNNSKEIDITENQVTPNIMSTFTNDTVNNFTEKTTSNMKIENSKENENNTRFMSDEIYNHFRPLESELRAEDMEKFLFFGQKLSTPLFGGENLTNGQSFSASTKSVNLISPSLERKKFTSRYSATEKTKNSSADEEEFNENMDASVVKNVIEKNKIRNSAKGPAPARHISLLNAYRKPLASVSTTGIPIFPETNLTLDGIKLSNLSGALKPNYRNLSRGHFNMRRRPVRLTTVDNPLTPANTTTEKGSTLVYTAVVTSVSITSSMKGQNKTEPLKELETSESSANLSQLNTNTSEIIGNQTESTTTRPSSTNRPYRPRVRIRTSTERIAINESIPSPTPFVLVNRRQPAADAKTASNVDSSLPSRDKLNSEVDEIGTKLSLDGILTIDKTKEPETVKDITSTTSIRPTSIFKTRRRPTTTTTTHVPVTTTISTTTQPLPASSSGPLKTTIEEDDIDLPSSIHATNVIEETGTTTNYNPEESKDQSYPTLSEANTTIESTMDNSTLTSPDKIKKSELPNEEVVIEAEKTYTASYVLAGLGFLPVTAIIVFVLRSVFLKKPKEIDTEYEGYFDDGDMKKESPITPVARLPTSLTSKPDKKWEFPRNKLRLQTLLGQGNFGQVWKAEADDLTGHDGLTRLVAVKTIKETATQKEKQELLHEICIMQKIGTHPNVVTLLACCTEQEPYLLIMEYVMCGKLLTYLRERRSRPDRFGGGGGALTSKDLTIFAYCVARGMEYLASKGIVHRDLAARNVLVDHNKLCKIADFGMSREAAPAGEGGGRAQRHALPVRWMAPEALLYNVFNHETDVWAYGILLWEIVTLGSTPYASMSGREVLQVVTEGYRLERPAHCKPALYRAMHSCWHASPDQRPPFASIKAQLAGLLENEPSEGNYVDLDSFYQDSSVYSDPSAIIPDDADGGISIGYSEEPVPRTFRNSSSTGNLNRNVSGNDFDARNFAFPPPLRSNFIGSPRMGGFGIRDVGFRDQNFNDRKEVKLSGSSFQREREPREGARENALVSRNSFSGGFQRLGSHGRDNHGFQLMSEGGRNKRVPEFECDI